MEVVEGGADEESVGWESFDIETENIKDRGSQGVYASWGAVIWHVRR